MGQSSSASSSGGGGGMARRQSVSAFLSKPKTEVTSVGSPVVTAAGPHHHGLAYMCVGMGVVGQGWRAHMEDGHVTEDQLPGLPEWAFYAVLDGHAGEGVARFSEKKLLGNVLYEVLPVRDSVQGIQDALRRAFLRHDKALQADFGILRDRSGSTCTSVLLTPTHFVFGNLGDSRSILCRGGRLTFATKDHKPTLTLERNRIRGAGGFVVNGRVDGGLAVSRAFGDFEYKMRTDLSVLQQKVVAEPDISVVERVPDRDDFLLLACDGVWDVMTNIAVLKFVQQRLRRNSRDLKGICAQLIRRCLDHGSRDNMSAILVVFNKNRPPRVGEANVNAPPPSEHDAALKIAASVAHNTLASAIAFLTHVHGTSVVPRTEPDLVMGPPGSAAPGYTGAFDGIAAARRAHGIGIPAGGVTSRISEELEDDEPNRLTSVAEEELLDSIEVARALSYTNDDEDVFEDAQDDGGYIQVDIEEEVEEDDIEENQVEESASLKTDTVVSAVQNEQPSTPSSDMAVSGAVHAPDDLSAPEGAPDAAATDTPDAAVAPDATDTPDTTATPDEGATPDAAVATEAAIAPDAAATDAAVAPDVPDATDAAEVFEEALAVSVEETVEDVISQADSRSAAAPWKSSKAQHTSALNSVTSAGSDEITVLAPPDAVLPAHVETDVDEDKLTPEAEV